MLLSSAKLWFVNGTFKVITKRFIQTWNIHAFVKHTGQTNQMPLLNLVTMRNPRQSYSPMYDCLQAKTNAPALRTS